MFDKVNPRQSFPELEDNITKFWKEHNIFKKSIEQRDPENKYVFYDGPPFITGAPHYGSLLPTIAKDVIPRYQTMNGKYVERQWGWDAHGLPIENKVEKQLGIENRRQIEEYGIQKFVDACYEYTKNTSAEWKWYIDKIGRWVDFDNSYKTMDQDYMESVIWVFKQIFEKDLIYEGTRTSLYCTRCGTPVSNFEIAMDNSYADMEDPAVTIRFPVITEGKFKDASILAWTTTPWTLPSNKALVVDPEEDYVLISINDEKIILAKKRAEYVLKEHVHNVEDTFKGEELVGLKYKPPFDYFEATDDEHKVYSFEGMVHMEEGTGIVHSAPGFGDIDTEMGAHYKLTNAMSIDDAGKYIAKVKDYEGIYVKDADEKIIADLTEAGILFKSDRIVHRYPYCWRCETPLIHKAQPSWYINIDKIREELIANNEHINWVPDHLKEGRFKKGIEVAPDWGISRTRFWATPMPVWQLVKKNDSGEQEVVERVVIGSRDELREKSVQPITKVILVRHATRDKSEHDGELTEDGWKEVEKLNELLASQEVDAIYTSTMKRCKQTIDEFASNKGLTPIEDDTFGSVDVRMRSDDLLDPLVAKHNVQFVSELPEEVVAETLKEDLNKLEEGFKKILKENEGKSIVISTHGEQIAFIKHLFERKNITEGYAAEIAKGSFITMYFVGDELLDLHRPKIDKITIKGEKGELTRVEDVLDVWLDSGSMPYASKHYPFQDRTDFEDNYPADFIVEYIAQTRAWFYVMHVISTALMGSHSFKNVITTGVLSGTDGRKMSKSYGNYPDPKGVLEEIGAEALRLYMMGSPIMIGGDMDFNEQTLKEQIKTIILPLWNSYSFFVTYANMHKWEPDKILAANIRTDNPDTTHIQWDHIPFDNPKNKLDVWIIAKLQLFIRDVRIALDSYNTPATVRLFPEMINDLSRWYIRRSRDRFAEGDKDALDTLYYVLVEMSKVMAPITPFVTEAIYQNLVAMQNKEEKQSIHLTDYPHPDIKFMEKSEELMYQMDKVRQIVALGQSVRVQNGLKVRQPLAEIEVISDIDPNRNIDIEQWMKELIMDELNVKKVDEKSELTDRDGWIRAKDDSNNIEISIDTNLTDALRREGMYRELVRQVQSNRKKSGMQIGDKISLQISSESNEVKTMLDLFKAELLSGTNANDIILVDTPGENWETAKLGDDKALFSITKVN
ncbi:class I tRNA ligase family protein [Candidatus Dojkabacteria bacterium]|uniref:Isoleucine--tRNA ligase n=1 Tax=Candidatus Dojkabacteria bacterium TaxID=2099670 RepID=A0A955RIT9_9BACT|nr:class I tRNA ligase family protein [Candidatus Dojkabacteria bacterium]